MRRTESSQNRTGTRGERGFSITEMLLVLAIMGIFITFAGPAFTESYRAYRVRSTALELSDVLRAVRQVSVSTRIPHSVVVDTAAGTYSWTDAKGRSRAVALPNGVAFISANPATVTFVTNGTVSTGAASLVVQGTVNSYRADRWTLDVNTVGRVAATRTQVAP